MGEEEHQEDRATFSFLSLVLVCPFSNTGSETSWLTFPIVRTDNTHTHIHHRYHRHDRPPTHPPASSTRCKPPDIPKANKPA